MKIELLNGVVTEDGKPIGEYNAETNTLHCQKRISPRLYTPIATAIGKKPAYDFGEPNKPSATSMVSVEKSEPGDGAPPHETLVADPPTGEPSKDPRYGDKTPAWARWLRDTDPVAFEKRFAGRKLILD